MNLKGSQIADEIMKEYYRKKQYEINKKREEERRKETGRTNDLHNKER